MRGTVAAPETHEKRQKLVLRRVSLKMTELDRLTSLPHMQLVKAALPYIHIPEQRFFSLFVKFRELEKTMQLFADPADGEIGICSVGERDKDSPVDMLKAIKPYGTEEEQSSIDLVLNFIEGSRLYESYWQNMPQTASFPTSQDIRNDSPNSDAVPASVLYPPAVSALGAFGLSGSKKECPFLRLRIAGNRCCPGDS